MPRIPDATAEAETELGYTPLAGRDDGRFLLQDRFWVTREGRARRIADLPNGYAANAAAFLMERAEVMKAYADTFCEETNAWTPGMDGIEFVRDSPLYLALVVRAWQPDPGH